MPSRWADTADDAAEDARKKAEKEEKKRLKAEKHRQTEEAQLAAAAAIAHSNGHSRGSDDDDTSRPPKRRRLSPSSAAPTPDTARPLLRFDPPPLRPSRSIAHFTLLNPIEEGSYGLVSRALDPARPSPQNVVAVKHLKISPARDAGFPVTALREIQCLCACAGHRHIVSLLEVVCGDTEANRGDTYIVMEFLEHDLRTLQEAMDSPFAPSEVKTLMLQLGSAVEFLHERWILHRDLKTSNILLNNRGEVKVADFGMARFVGDPGPANLTQMVVTLWYRAPELLLGAKEYDGAVDVWSLGCVFGELLTKQPVLQGKNEVDQLSKILALRGIPTESSWPGFKRLPHARTLRLPPATTTTPQNHTALLRARFPSTLTTSGLALLASLLSLNPASRHTAKEMLEHAYFREDPRPKPTGLFPTFPSKAGQEKRRRLASPAAPVRGKDGERGIGGGAGEVDFSGIFGGAGGEEGGGGFALKLV
ncbi:hypothetical protein LTR53_012304 [Teratosphaeriaceae sp. CCFEE 6253]|nr:hypothetical protein LTR53_012304 [Teratosphaeriaceae sp. CCFEE 6253]